MEVSTQFNLFVSFNLREKSKNMGILEKKEKIFKCCRVIGATMCISGMFLSALQSDTIAGLVFGYICYIGIFLYIIARIFDWRLKKGKDKMNKDRSGKLQKTPDQPTAEEQLSILEENDLKDEPADTIQDEPIILQEGDIELIPEQTPEATPSVAEPKKPDFTLNHWSVGIVLLGILFACSPSMDSFGIGLIFLGVGIFVATMTRKFWLVIPFFFIFLTATIYNCTHNPSMVNYRKRGYDAAANADAKNAYTAAQAYFTDYPTATVTLPKLKSHGFVPSSNVTLTIISGRKSKLQIIAIHSSGTKTYTADSDGNISSQKR